MPSLLARVLRDWFTPPHWSEGPVYRAKSQWIEAFQSARARHGGLAMDQARVDHARAVEGFDRLDDKLADLLRTAGLLATILVAGAAKLDMPAPPSLRAALALLIAAMATCIVGRRALLRPGGLPLADLMAPLVDDVASAAEGELVEVPNPEAWLAAGLEGATLAYRDLEEWKSRKINAAGMLLLAAMALLLPSLFGR